MALQKWHTDRYGSVADTLSNDPSPSRFSKWFGGIACPAGLTILACRCWMLEKAVLPGESSSMRLDGNDAKAIAIVWAAVGLFLFAHYFCTDTSIIYRIADLAKTISLIAFIGSLGYIIFQVLTP